MNVYFSRKLCYIILLSVLYYLFIQNNGRCNTSHFISQCTGLLEEKQSKAVIIHKENKRNISTALKPLTLIEIQENITRLPKVKYYWQEKCMYMDVWRKITRAINATNIQCYFCKLSNASDFILGRKVTSYQVEFCFHVFCMLHTTL